MPNASERHERQVAALVARGAQTIAAALPDPHQTDRHMDAIMRLTGLWIRFARSAIEGLPSDDSPHVAGGTSAATPTN